MGPREAEGSPDWPLLTAWHVGQPCRSWDPSLRVVREQTSGEPPDPGDPPAKSWSPRHGRDCEASLENGSAVPQNENLRPHGVQMLRVRKAAWRQEGSPAGRRSDRRAALTSCSWMCDLSCLGRDLRLVLAPHLLATALPEGISRG